MARAVATQSRHRWSDFVALPEDDRRELVDGRLVEVEMPTKWHEVMCAKLMLWLGAWAERRGGLQVLGSGYRLRISDSRGAVPDVQLMTDELYEQAGDNGLESGHPELVIEVVSPSSRTHDGLRKLDWYAHLGVPEYWLVNPDTRSLVAHRLQSGVYAIIQHADGDTVFKSKSFKGLKIPLAELWKVLPKQP
jgi:Uma2 family endonuclease